MNGKDFHKEVVEKICKNKDKYTRDNERLMEAVDKSDATFDGRPVPTLYHPYYVTEEDYDNFTEICKTMLNIIDKITDEYIENPSFRENFLYPKFIEELILIDNKYHMNVPMARFDFFYDSLEKFSFIELNTDGASFMNEDNTLAKISLESELSKDLGQIYDLDYFELFESWVDESIKIYQDFDKSNDKPNVAIMDFKESATINDFNKFKDAYIRKGYKCKIIDPRDVVYKDGKMYFEDYRIDLVYRRIVTFELINKADEIGDFIEAYKNQAFCSIGSIRSQIGHNKIFFKILHDEDTLELLNDKERDYVRKHIPYTALFSGGEDIFQKVLSNKDKYIMKPMDMNASQGVFVGRDMDQEEWKKNLEEVWNKDYIYQEFIDPYGREFAVFDGDKLEIKDFGVVVGVFLYGGKVAGVYSRIGNENIISNVADYYSIPGIKVDMK